MTSDIKAECLLFITEEGLLIPFADFRQRTIAVPAHRDNLTAAEKRILSGLLFPLQPLANLHRLFKPGHELGTVAAESVEGSTLDQRLDNFFIHLTQVDPLAKIL